MFILKGCPKCNGDLVAEATRQRLGDDTDVACIQCGYYLRPEEQKGVVSRWLRRPHRVQPVPAYATVRR